MYSFKCRLGITLTAPVIMLRFRYEPKKLPLSGDERQLAEWVLFKT